jgi:hypothetical protein
MKKLLTLASAGVAVLAIAGSAYAATTATAPSTPTASQQVASANHHKGTFNNQQLLSLLKVDANTLQQDLKAGKSIADIASAQGVQEQSVIDLLVSQETQKLDQALQAGKLTQDQLTKEKADLQNEIKNRVEHKGGFGFGDKRGHRGGEFKDAAAVLGMNAQDIQSQLQSGKSLVQIAQAKGISETDLVNQLLQKDKERLTKMVEQIGNQKPDTNADVETNDNASSSPTNNATVTDNSTNAADTSATSTSTTTTTNSGSTTTN